MLAGKHYQAPVIALERSSGGFAHLIRNHGRLASEPVTDKAVITI